MFNLALLTTIFAPWRGNCWEEEEEESDSRRAFGSLSQIRRQIEQHV